MSTITIHYESPANDPFKVPRPHRVEIDAHGEASEAFGGEIGRVGNLLGFCPTPTPDVNDWKIALAESLYDGVVGPDELVGWYPQFSGVDGIFGYNVAIRRIEVMS